MLDTIKHGFKKIADVTKDIPKGLMFIIQCSLICMFWITVIT